MANQAVQSTWREYREAIGAIYQRPVEAVAESALGIETTPREEDVDWALDRSQDLENVLVDALNSADPADQDEAAYLLQSGALADLSVADDLIGLEAPDGLAPGGLELEVVADVEELQIPTLAQVFNEIDAAFQSPEMPSIGGAADGDSDPKADLKSAVDQAAKKIVDKAGEATADALQGAIGAGVADTIGDAVVEGVTKVFGELSDGVKLLVRKAVQFLLQGLSKLLAIFGTTAGKVLSKIAEWIKGLKGPGVASLLGRLYQVDAIKTDLHSRIDGSSSLDQARADAAARELAALSSRFEKHASIHHRLVWVLGKVRRWIIGVSPPVGAYGVALAYAIALAYPVFSGGDYLDWRNSENSGLLEIVPGVRCVTSSAMDLAPPLP